MKEGLQNAVGREQRKMRVDLDVRRRVYHVTWEVRNQELLFCLKWL